MKKAAPIGMLMGVLLCVGILLCTATSSFAQNQNKLACISFNEVLVAMPEFKKADTTLAQYRQELEQKFEAMKTEYDQQITALSSKDTVKFSKPQLNLKRQSLAELLAKLQGYDQEAGQLLNQRRSTLLQPIQKKAEDAIQAVSKDNGYAYVFEKDNLHVYPPSDDILPLVKKKLGLN
jgi:outer membrane protein